MTKDNLNEMWAALAKYQTKADANSHGESWAKMCREKTRRAAADAAYAAAAAYAVEALPAAAYAADAAAADAADAANRAIKYITVALKEQND